MSLTRPAGSPVPNTLSGDRYDQLFEQAPIAILTIEPDRRIVACNNAASGLLGAPRLQVVGSLFVDWIAPHERHSVDGTLRRAFHGEVTEARATLLRADGLRRRHSVRLGPVGEGNGDLGAVNVYLREVAEERATAFAPGEQMQRVLEVVELLETIGRELSASVTILEASAERLLTQAPPATPLFAADRVIREARRSRQIVEALVMLTSSVHLHAASRDLADMVGDLAAEYRPSLDAASIAMSLEIAPDLPRVSLSPEHVRYLLWALIDNARDAIGEGTSAEWVSGHIRVEAARSPKGVLLRVSDNGVGIPAGRAESIFEPFFTTKQGHVGLDLTTARGIIAVRGGRIWAQRSADHWTVLSVELPAAAPSPATPLFPGLTAHTGRSVLVVDDDPAIRGAMQRVLSAVGYEVSEARSGRSALAQITSSATPDFLVTDLKMENGSGYWLLTLLAKEFPGLLRRTVIITAEPWNTTVEQIARETGCRVLRKPFEIHELLAALDEAAKK